MLVIVYITTIARPYHVPQTIHICLLDFIQNREQFFQDLGCIIVVSDDGEWSVAEQENCRLRKQDIGLLLSPESERE